MAASNVISKVIKRPKEVENAIKLMLTAIALGALVGYLSIPVEPGHQYFQTYIYITLLGVLINIYFVHKISQNRNWARNFYIIFTLISIVYYLPQLFSNFVSTPLNGILQLITLLIQLASVYLLLSKQSKSWFMLVKKNPASPGL